MTINTQPPVQYSGFKSIAAFAVFFVLCFAASSMGIFFGPGEWYDSLNRPSFAPPDWLFGPVWTLLYIMIALSGWLVWRRVGWGSSLIKLWLIQLALNALWPPLFFGLQMPGVALAEMGLFWIAIAACIMHFRPVSNVAAWLLLPYLAWVTFAFVLNMGFWWLN